MTRDELPEEKRTRCGERNEHLIEKEPTAEEPSEVQGDHFADVSKKVISSM